MNVIETGGRGFVPERAIVAAGPARSIPAIGRSAPSGPGPDGPVRRLLARGSVAVLVAGIVLNVGWIALLGWGSFRTVRWFLA